MAALKKRAAAADAVILESRRMNRSRMKKSWRAAVMIAALSIVFGGMSVVSAQQEPQPPIAGGYAETSNGGPEVMSAARYATRAQGRRQRAVISLVSIERAEVQVVAGLNYRLRLTVKIKGKTENATAVVYQNLRQRYSLSDWKVDSESAGGSKSASSLSTIEELVKAFAEAYEAKSLGRLDGQRLLFGNVKIVTDDSLSGKSKTRAFKTFAGAERWLRSLEVSDDLPHRQTMPLEQCSKGVCTFNFDNGILHNQLYLQEITYGYRGGRPYIKKISLLDGD
jgi:hypothetical protein